MKSFGSCVAAEAVLSVLVFSPVVVAVLLLFAIVMCVTQSALPQPFHCPSADTVEVGEVMALAQQSL